MTRRAEIVDVFLRELGPEDRAAILSELPAEELWRAAGLALPRRGLVLNGEAYYALSEYKAAKTCWDSRGIDRCCLEEGHEGRHAARDGGYWPTARDGGTDGEDYRGEPFPLARFVGGGELAGIPRLATEPCPFVGCERGRIRVEPGTLLGALLSCRACGGAFRLSRRAGESDGWYLAVVELTGRS